MSDSDRDKGPRVARERGGGLLNFMRQALRGRTVSGAHAELGPPRAVITNSKTGRAACALVAVQTVAVQMTLTDRPVWPEDEALEDAALAVRGERPAVLAPLEQAREVLDRVEVDLPQLLVPAWAGAAPDAGLDAAVGDLLAGGFWLAEWSVPVSLMYPDTMLLRRLAVVLRLEPGAGSTGASVFLVLEPSTQVAATSEQVGEVGLDVGKLGAALLPQLPDAFVVKFSKALTRQHVDVSLRAEGEGRSTCSWRVSSPELAATFQPAAIARIGAEGARLTAELHVELRREWLGGVWHKTYLRSAQPKSYHLVPPPVGRA